MGVALYVHGYQKAPDCILGDLEILGFYEVLLDKVQQYEIKEAFCVVSGRFECVRSIIEGEYHCGYGYEQIRDLKLLMDSLPGLVDGWGIRFNEGETSMLMYDPRRLTSILQRIIDVFENIPEKPGWDKREEKQEIEALVSSLEIISERDGIARLSYG